MFIKDITYTGKSALYIDLSIDIDSKGQVIGRNATTKEMILTYKLWTFYFNHDCVTIFKIQQKKWGHLGSNLKIRNEKTHLLNIFSCE